LDLEAAEMVVFLGKFSILVTIPTTSVLGIILAKSAAGNDEVFSRVSFSPLLQCPFWRVEANETSGFGKGRIQRSTQKERISKHEKQHAISGPVAVCTVFRYRKRVCTVGNDRFN
jgi:hypothetical protein